MSCNIVHNHNNKLIIMYTTILYMYLHWRIEGVGGGGGDKEALPPPKIG